MKLAYLKLTCFKILSWRHQIGSLGKTEHKPGIFLRVAIRDSWTWPLDWCWRWNSNTLTTWHEEPTHWRRPWCWERLKVGGEGEDRGWDGWMASLTRWTWVWVGSGSWWWTGRPGVCVAVHGVAESDTTEQLNWTELNLTTGFICPDLYSSVL